MGQPQIKFGEATIRCEFGGSLSFPFQPFLFFFDLKEFLLWSLLKSEKVFRKSKVSVEKKNAALLQNHKGTTTQADTSIYPTMTAHSSSSPTPLSVVSGEGA